MKALKVVFASAALALLASHADAQVVFKAPMEFAGTGCKPGSYTFTGEGTDTLTVMFSSYDAGIRRARQPAECSAPPAILRCLSRCPKDTRSPP